jgi:hypothetical protein
VTVPAEIEYLEELAMDIDEDGDDLGYEDVATNTAAFGETELTTRRINRASTAAA